jgi:hypothetical protein
MGRAGSLPLPRKTGVQIKKNHYTRSTVLPSLLDIEPRLVGLGGLHTQSLLLLFFYSFA